jgi:hypothetical protein
LKFSKTFEGLAVGRGVVPYYSISEPTHDLRLGGLLSREVKSSGQAIQDPMHIVPTHATDSGSKHGRERAKYRVS